MTEDWAEAMADRILGSAPPARGKLLFLGAADTGKTTLMFALASRLAHSGAVALVDADIGQSHIGPPATVGWTILDASVTFAHTPQSDDPAPMPDVKGIAFVGDVTPAGHLLQLTAALALCVEQAQRAADVVLIDTPGFVAGGAACALWWTVQRLLRPKHIIAIQRGGELADLLRGLQPGLSSIDLPPAPPEFRPKSPEARRQHRDRFWSRYFRNATAHTLDLKDVTVRAMRGISADYAPGRIVGLADAAGEDMALGAIERWRQEKATATLRAPGLDVHRVQCLTIGNVRIDIPSGRS